MNPADDVTIQCPMCYRRAAPKLRAVASGLLAVCPYCLSPHLRERRGQGRSSVAPAGALARDAKLLEARHPAARSED
jgi:hypothetical protein